MNLFIFSSDYISSKFCFKVPENTPDIEVGSLIAVLVEEGKDWRNVKVPEGAGAKPDAPKSKPAEKPDAAPKSKPAEKPGKSEQTRQLTAGKAHGRTTKLVSKKIRRFHFVSTI